MDQKSNRFLSASENNRRLVGVPSSGKDTRTKLYFNEAVSDVLFHDDETYRNATAFCAAKLRSKIAFVSFSFTSADAVRIENHLRGGVEVITVVGGLLSLYIGFSSLSLVEIGFWLLVRNLARQIRMLVKMLCKIGK